MFLFKWFVITALLLILGFDGSISAFLGFVGAVIDSMFEDSD